MLKLARNRFIHLTCRGPHDGCTEQRTSRLHDCRKPTSLTHAKQNRVSTLKRTLDQTAFVAFLTNMVISCCLLNCLNYPYVRTLNRLTKIFRKYSPLQNYWTTTLQNRTLNQTTLQYITVFTGYGTRSTVSTRTILWPIDCECMQEGKAVTPWPSGRQALDSPRVQGETYIFIQF
jgi:hypothetical protein